MKALILNSGVGRRMGVLTSEHPKCMTDISKRDTILSRQLKLLSECGVTEVIMTTGLFNDVLVDYCNSLNLPMTYTFVYNRDYAVTNYIQSIYCARDEVRDEDILLLFSAEKGAGKEDLLRLLDIACEEWNKAE